MGLLEQSDALPPRGQQGLNDSRRQSNVNNNNVDDNDDDAMFPEQHCFDPCKACSDSTLHNSNSSKSGNGNGACIAAFQATVDCSVDQFQNTMTCGHGSLLGWPHSAANNMGKFHPANYFKRNIHRTHHHHHHSTSFDDTSASNHSHSYLYSPSAPVGPTRCEYCGNDNAEDCVSNVPEEYLNHLSMDTTKQKGQKRISGVSSSTTSSSSRQPRSTAMMIDCTSGNNGDCMNIIDDSCTSSSSDQHPRNNNNEKTKNMQTKHLSATANSSTTAAIIICPRPKLFFLKKRPPFAELDGWNPDTEYRMNLFEPPSSEEGLGRGKREVRGHLGNNHGTSPTTNSGSAVINGGVGVSGAEKVGLSNTSTVTTMGKAVLPTNVFNKSLSNQSTGNGGDREMTMMMPLEASFLSMDDSSGDQGGGGIGAGTATATTRSYSPVQWIRGWMGATGSLPPPS